jgi:adenosylcobinamide kinase / adenosylcobinamide-phosphate guanylyltransferase
MSSTFFLGGARSGKSSLAVRKAHDAAGAGHPITFVVTAEALDGEMNDRIQRHRDERPASWNVVEAPRALASALSMVPTDHFVVVDCVSFWVANLVMDDLPAAAIEAQAAVICSTMTARQANTVVVSNEVGLGLVPDNPLGRSFRDTLGRVNALLCNSADEAFLVVAGRTLRLD